LTCIHHLSKLKKISNFKSDNCEANAWKSKN
jgi:hypothetical protein